MTFNRDQDATILCGKVNTILAIEGVLAMSYCPDLLIVGQVSLHRCEQKS